MSAPDQALPLAAVAEDIVNESVLDVLIYIYENYMDGDDSPPPDQVLLEEELVQAGFTTMEIRRAFDWLDELAWRQGSLTVNELHPTRSVRVFTEAEQQQLDLETQGMLLSLEYAGVLDMRSRELVIERALAIGSELSAEDVKWIALLVLLNQPGREEAFAIVEEMVYNGQSGHIH